MTREVHFFAGVENEDIDAFVHQLQEEAKLPATRFQLPQEWLSVSQVTMYQRCPRQYYFRYVESLIVPPGSHLVEGSAIHRALEHTLRAKQKQDLLPVDTMVDVFRDTWKAQANEVVYDEGESEKSVFERGRRFLSLYRQEHLPQIEPHAVEKRFVTAFPNTDIPIVGFIDLIDAGEEDQLETVVDHKVSGRMKSTFEVNNDMQLTLYAYATQLPKVRFDVFLKNKTPVIKTIRSVRTSQDVRWAAKVFEEVASAISTGLFPPCDPKSYVCDPKQCGYHKRCREEI